MERRLGRDATMRIPLGLQLTRAPTLSQDAGLVLPPGLAHRDVPGKCCRRCPGDPVVLLP